MSQNSVSIGSVDFLWIFFLVCLLSSLLHFYSVLNFVQQSLFSLLLYLWCNLSCRFQHCLVGSRVCGFCFCNDVIVSAFGWLCGSTLPGLHQCL